MSMFRHTSRETALEFINDYCGRKDFDHCSDEQVIACANNILKHQEQEKYKDLERYPEDENQENYKFVTITKIVVPTERDKQQLLRAIEYLHNQDIDTEYYAVNTLVHVYERPELIEVSNES